MKKTRRQQHGGGGIPLRGIRKSNNNKKNKSSSVELITSSDKRFRGKVLASVGLDDDDDDDDENDINNDNDDESYDKCDDIEEATASLRQKHHDNDNTNKRMRKKKNKNKNKSENAELIDDDEEDNICDDEDYEEYESFDQTTSSSHRCSKLKPICHNLLWIIAAIAAVVFILYDDEKLEESEIDEDVIQKDQQHQQPYSYNGYKDARIPDDDVAQFGGGILYNNNENGASGALPSNSEEEEEDNNVENEMIDQVEVTNHHHEPSGIVEVDILWEQLDGYAEMSEPLEANDLPVFWHIREYYINISFLLKPAYNMHTYSIPHPSNLSNLFPILHS